MKPEQSSATGALPAGSETGGAGPDESRLWFALLVAAPLVELGSYFLFPPGWGRLYAINLGQTLASLVAWLLLRRLAAAGDDPALQPFWRMLARGALAWFAGNLTYFVVQVVFNAASLPGWQDLFFLPAYAAMFAAFVTLPRPARPPPARLNNLIDVSGLLLATLLVGWHFRLHEAVLLFMRRPDVASGYTLVYPVLDVAVLWMLSLRARNLEGTSLAAGTMGWLIGGLFALIAADFSMPDIIVRAPLQGGGTLSDIGWGVFSTCWGLAGLVQLRRSHAHASGSAHPFRSRQVTLLLVTSSWVSGMVLLLIHGLFTSETRRQAAQLEVGVVALLALVVVRQIREVLNNEQLNRLVAELGESRGQFRQLFQLFPDAAQLSSLENGRFAEVNEGFTRTFGYSYDECVGRTSGELRLWVDQADRDVLVRELLQEGMFSRRESRVRRKDGVIIPVEISGRLVELAGQRYILSLLRDLTEKRTAEEHLRRNEAELRRAQKLEAIGGLAGGIAHDVNNMLTPIMGGTELSLMDLPAGHPARPPLENVLEASRRARDIVRQILTFSRRAESQAELIDSGPVVRAVLRQVQAQLPANIRLQHVRRNPPAIIGDSTQLHQVMLNLCTNAALALKGRPDGLIEVVEEAFRADGSLTAGQTDFHAGDYLHVSVRDTGVGMSPAVLERIFEPFFTTRRAGEGTGLGLAVVHGIVKQHQGVLKVYSAPGEGSIFHIYLPAAPATASSPALGGDHDLPAGAGQEVVCIDDDDMVLEIVSGLLGRLGYKMRTFGTAATAQAYLCSPESASTAAVICDYAMPDMDGITLAQSIGRHRGGLPWVLLSGYLGEETLKRARAAGLEHFMDKPPSVDLLAATLRRLTARTADGA